MTRQHAVTALVGILAALGAMLLASPDAKAERVLVEIERCLLEDGSDVDGPCLWIDPDTGEGYLNG